MKPSGKISDSVAFTLLLLAVLLIFNNTCQRFEPEQLVIIETGSVSDVGYKSCTATGEIYDIGEDGITQHGFCWSETPNPTVENSEMNQLGSSSNTGTFTGIVTGLSMNTTYYIRAYGKNDTRTAYGSENTFKTLTPNSVKDFDGNIYQTVVIGNQTWIAENLKTTKYNDGTAIPLVPDPTIWKNLTTPGYCWYNNDEASYKATYGALYNWYVVNTGKLCPTGWHVPSQDEWTILISYLGGESVAGGKLKETGTLHWFYPNTGATNESGFTALPGGRRESSSDFELIGYFSDWWSSTEYLTTNARNLSLYGDYSGVYNTYDNKEIGSSVRCVKDAE